MSDLERRAMLAVAGVGAVGALAAMVKAGPLNPPAGAVAGTGRTLDEVYNKIPGVNGTGDGRVPIAGGTNPVTISQPGSYVLTGNITVAGNGITISASDVTLDLNGFTVTSTGTTGSPVLFGSVPARVVVRNGVTVGGQYGVSNSGFLTDGVVEDMIVRNPKLTGIWLRGTGVDRVVVRRCRVTGVGSTTTSADSSPFISGIAVSASNARIEDCSISGLSSNASGTSTLNGITTNSSGSGGVLIARCCVSQSTSLAATAISLLGGVVYRDNTVVNYTNGYSGGTNGGGNV